MSKSINYTEILNRFLLEAGIILSAAVIISTPLFANAETLNRQLEIGMNGSDVSVLQTFLALDKTIYPQGLVTGYFGPLTKSAVSNFQARNGISTVGRVGPITLSALNAQMVGGISVGADLVAPLITSLNITTTNTSASVSWNTDSLARGKVYYSTSPIMLSNTFEQTGIHSVEPGVSGILAQNDGASKTYHNVNINGLSPNTRYYYLVEVLDSSNNASITSPSSFYTNQ